MKDKYPHNWVSSNVFHWISWIQWIKTKCKSSMVTRDNTPYVTTGTFLDVVVKIFPLLSLGWDLFTVMSHNGEVIPLVIILFLDFVMIHWINWIQWNSFSEIHSGKTPIVLMYAARHLWVYGQWMDFWKKIQPLSLSEQLYQYSFCRKFSLTFQILCNTHSSKLKCSWQLAIHFVSLYLHN